MHSSPPRGGEKENSPSSQGGLGTLPRFQGRHPCGGWAGICSGGRMAQESSQGRPPSSVHEGSPSALRAPSGWEKKATWSSPPSGRCALGGRQSALLASAVDHTLRDALDRLLGIPVSKRGNRHRVVKKPARICPRPGLHDQEPFCPAASLPPSPPGPGLRGLWSAAVETPNGRGPHRGAPGVGGRCRSPRRSAPQCSAGSGSVR